MAPFHSPRPDNKTADYDNHTLMVDRSVRAALLIRSDNVKTYVVILAIVTLSFLCLIFFFFASPSAECLVTKNHDKDGWCYLTLVNASRQLVTATKCHDAGRPGNVVTCYIDEHVLVTNESLTTSNRAMVRAGNTLTMLAIGMLIAFSACASLIIE